MTGAGDSPTALAFYHDNLSAVKPRRDGFLITLWEHTAESPQWAIGLLCAASRGAWVVLYQSLLKQPEKVVDLRSAILVQLF